MHLSKILCDRRRWDVIRDLDARDRLHRKILAFFPKYAGGGRPDARKLLGILFRVEERSILLQSRLAPDPKAIVPGYSIQGTKEVSAHYGSVRAGSVYRFRLDANTSRQVAEVEPEWIPEAPVGIVTQTRTKRVGCGSDDERRHWCEAHLVRSGASPVEYSLESLPVLRAGGALFEASRFEGILRVTRREDFLSALREGIGRGKAYGLGLLSIRNS